MFPCWTRAAPSSFQRPSVQKSQLVFRPKHLLKKTEEIKVFYIERINFHHDDSRVELFEEHLRLREIMVVDCVNGRTVPADDFKAGHFLKMAVFLEEETQVHEAQWIPRIAWDFECVAYFKNRLRFAQKSSFHCENSIRTFFSDSRVI